MQDFKENCNFAGSCKVRAFSQKDYSPKKKQNEKSNHSNFCIDFDESLFSE